MRGAGERIDDLGQAVANLIFEPTTGSQNDARVYIRGVGQDTGDARVDPGVGLYVDGIYLPRAQGSLLPMIDVERVEVLRGPQGTLYGKNTIGGVVQVITRRPQPELGGSAQVSLGSRDLLRTRLTVNTPVGFGTLHERLFTRISVATATADGYQRNGAGGGRPGDDKLLATRVAVRWLPTDAVEVDVDATRSLEREEAFVGKCQLGNRLTLGAFAVDNFVQDPSFVEACQESQNASELHVFADRVDRVEQDVLATGARLAWDLGRWQVQSLSSWRTRADEGRGGDSDGTRAAFINSARRSNEHQAASQEVQLHGKLLDDRLDLVTGIYGFREKGHGENEGNVLRQLVLDPGTPLRGDVSNDLGAQNLARFGIDIRTFDGVDQAAKRLLDPTAPEGPGPLRARLGAVNRFLTDHFRTLSYAAYGDATFRWTDRISLTAGVRFTHERKARRGDRSPLFPELGSERLAEGNSFSARFERWTPHFAASYALTENVLAYASFSQGFKSGGFTQTVVRQDSADRLAPFGPEKLDSYEIGLKTAWLERRLALNLVLYEGRYRNIQLSNMVVSSRDGTLTTVIRSAGRATTRGLELELRAQPFAGLTLAGGLGLSDADYAEFEDLALVPPRNPTGCTSTELSECGVTEVIGLLQGGLLRPTTARVDKSDLEFKNNPAVTFNALVRWESEAFAAGRLSMQASWYFRSKVFFDLDNTESIAQSRYGLLDLRVALALPDGRTSLALGLKNALDRRYRSGGLNVEDATGSNLAFYGPPRTWSVELRREF